MELAALVLTYSAAASTIIASSITIVAIVRADRTTSTNKPFATTIALLIAAAAALTISSNLTGALFWVMAPAVLAFLRLRSVKLSLGCSRNSMGITNLTSWPTQRPCVNPPGLTPVPLC